MKKALLLMASPRAGWSDGAAETLAEILAEKGVQVRTAAVREEEIGYCRGCGACMGRGEKACPMSGDGAQRLLSEMLWADGVVILTPNYALQVPALLKNLLDRLSFVFHRPRFFGRVFMPIIAQGIYGGRGVHKYLNDTMEFWGFRPVKGAVLQGALYPNEKLSAEAAGKNREKLGAAAGRFVDALNSERPKKPSFFRLMIFRTTSISRTRWSRTAPILRSAAGSTPRITIPSRSGPTSGFSARSRMPTSGGRRRRTRAGFSNRQII